MTKTLVNLKNNLKEKVSNSKFVKRFSLAFLAMLGYSKYAYAAPAQDGYLLIENLIDVATTWIRYLGAIVFVYGLVAVIMAWKSHNSEGQANAGMWVVVGAMLCAIKSIVTAIGVLG